MAAERARLFRERTVRLRLGLSGWLFVCLLAACARPPLPPPARLQPDEAAWEELAPAACVSSRALLSWRAADGRHGRSRVWLLWARPERLRFKWLTPWGSVAGELLLVGERFWFSDARRRQTWRGRSRALADCFPGLAAGLRGSLAYLAYWPLLCSRPDADRRRFPELETVSLARRREGRTVELVKFVTPPGGGRVEIHLADFIAVPGGIWPCRIMLEGAAGRLELELREPVFPPAPAPGSFVYRKMKNFVLHDCGTESEEGQ